MKEATLASGVTVSEVDLCDRDWLGIVCRPVLEKLQDRGTFDQDALIWRHHQDERRAYLLLVRKYLLAAREARYSPLDGRMLDALAVDHPKTWHVCPDCIGQNLDHPDCIGCSGARYKVKCADLLAKK